MSENHFTEYDTSPPSLFDNRYFRGFLFSISVAVILWGVASYLVYHTSYFDDRPYFSTPQRLESIKSEPLLNLLVNREYVKLNENIDLIINRSEHPDEEYILRNTLWKFARYDRGLEKFFDEWVEEYSVHAYPYMARSIYYYYNGSIARGRDYMVFTNPIRKLRMKMYFERAINDMYRAMEIMPESLVPHIQMLSIAQGTMSKSEKRKIFDKAALIKPESLELRWRYIQTLHPKWGGSYVEMKAFVHESQKYFDENPRLKRLEGFLLAYQADKIAAKGTYCDAIELYRQALETGENSFFYSKYGQALACDHFDYEAMEALQKSAEKWSHSDFTFQLLARIYMRLSKYEQAEEAINKAIVLNPVNSSLYGDRAEINLNLRNYEAGINDAEYAIYLNDKEIENLELGILLIKSPNYLEKIETLSADNEKYQKLIILTMRSNQNGKLPFTDEEYDVDGNLKYVYQYANGRKNGIAYEYRPNMSLKTKWTYLDGVKSNPSYEYYENGAIQYEYNYVDGKLNGVSKEFYVSGELKAERILVNGKEHGLSKEFYKTGELKYERNYIKGKLNGKTSMYFSTGEKRVEWNYINDLINGDSAAYHSNGTVQYATSYKNNKIYGEVKQYSFNGELESEWIFENDTLLPETKGFVEYKSINNILYKNSITSIITDIKTPGDNFTVFPKELENIHVHTSFKGLEDGVVYSYKIEFIDPYGDKVFTCNYQFVSTNGFANTWCWYGIETELHKIGEWKFIVYLNDEVLEELSVLNEGLYSLQ